MRADALERKELTAFLLFLSRRGFEDVVAGEGESTEEKDGSKASVGPVSSAS